MSVRSGITLLGTVVGAFFGAPQLGFVLGSLVGGIVDPVKIEGPRMTDAKAMTARDGVPIPWGRGIFRVAGTMIACQPGEPTEHKHTESQGKGGPKQTTYTYTRTHAVLICEGPIDGVRRIWRNGELVYDTTAPPAASDYADEDAYEAAYESWIQGQASTEDWANKFTLYLGSETQNPDPELEAIFGAGEVNAHRGTSYVVIPDDDVTETGGAVPQYEFEVFYGETGSVAPRYAMYMADSGGTAVTMYDRRGGTGMSTFATGTSPRGVALNPKFAYVAVCNRLDGTVTIRNTITQTNLVTVTCGTRPIACCWSISGLTLFVVDSNDHKVRSCSLAGAVSSPSAALSGNVGNHTGICITPDGTELWVTTDFGVDVLSTGLSITNSITASNAGRIAMHPLGTYAYSCHQAASNYYRYNVAAKTVGAPIALDGIGKDVCFLPDGSYAFFAINNSHEAVQRVNGNTGVIGPYVTTTDNDGPQSICCDDLGQYLLVPTAGYVVDVFRVSDFTLFDSVPVIGTPGMDYCCARALP